LTHELIEAAAIVADRLDPAQRLELHDLASNTRQGIFGSARHWAPFADALMENAIDRRDRNHATALMFAASMQPRPEDIERAARMKAARK